jgi:putative endonuclease
MTQAEPAPVQHWFVYVVRTARGMLYTGISTDPARRLIEHESGARGARSLRGKGPLQLVFQWPVGSRSEAGRLEARIKKLDRQRKLQLVRAELDPAVLLD